ncbi:MAG: hypothetical protein GY835_00215 [bacterium]|nr:hypothetical protein [bacterium]
MPHNLDKVAHFVLYAGLSVVFIAVSGIEVAGAGRTLLTAITLAAVVGVCDELYQGLIPYRTRELGDWVADFTGGSCGALLMVTIRRSGLARRGDTR